MPETPVVLVGLGFTAKRLALRLLRKGRSVYSATRDPGRFGELGSEGLIVGDFVIGSFPAGAVVVHTIPPIPEGAQTALHEFVCGIQPVRVVYVSATSVYGDLQVVDEGSPVGPSTVPGVRRLEEERWIEAGPWSSLILRAAAIYGPGRGAHRRILNLGTAADGQRRGPSGLVSRIHVDDLAALAEAGIDSRLAGAYPAADELPCSTEAILRWSAEYLGLDPESLDLTGPVTTGRGVDGGAVCRELGVSLEFPDYRTGIPQCLGEEGTGLTVVVR